MPEENAEVRVSLVADNQAAEVTKAVVEGFRLIHEQAQAAAGATEKLGEHAKAAGEKTHEAGEHSKGLASEILKADIEMEALKEGAELVGEAFKQAYEMAEQLADAAMEAADAQEEQVRTMAGNLFLMDQGKHSMQSLRDYAGETREEFAGFGIEAGVATKAVTEAYDALIARGNIGSEQAKELAMQMAVVGKVVPGGVQGLADGFNMIELGMVKARNPVVQLIASTHMLQGNAHQVAAAMQKMTPEHQMELANKAIEKQAEQLGKYGQNLGAPSMGELKTSFEGVKESFLESMGKPMEEALIPHLVALRSFLAKHIEQIEEFGREAGEAAAKVIDYLSEAVEGAYEGFHEDWDQMKHLASEMEEAWGVIFGKAGDTRTQFRILADDLVQVFAGLLHTVEMANDIAHAQKVGTTEAEVQRGIAEKSAMDAHGADGRANTEKELKKYLELKKAMGEDDAMTQEVADHIKQIALVRSASSNKAEADLKAGNMGGYDNYLAGVIKNQDESGEAFALNLLKGSKEAQSVLDMAAGRIDGGMVALMKVIHDRAPELEEQLKKMQPGKVGPEGIPAPKFTGPFIGQANIDIKQDFKDQDPDRIIMTFKRDLQSAAANRVQSRFSTPFGA